MNIKSKKNRFEEATKVFRHHDGILRMSEALCAGISRSKLYSMLEADVVERLSRGLYRLTNLSALGNPDLVSVAMKVPQSVITLISALAFHEITTQVPHEIYIALKRGAEPPRLKHPPIRVFWFTGNAFSDGVEQYDVDGTLVRIYSPEKTIADCFKYRNKIGLDVALEALKLYREKIGFKVDDLMHFARSQWSGFFTVCLSLLILGTLYSKAP
jgi:predicted transcriptional regulator of viral defense system